MMYLLLLRTAIQQLAMRAAQAWVAIQGIAVNYSPAEVVKAHAKSLLEIPAEIP
jgi:hypothetical protein